MIKLVGLPIMFQLKYVIHRGYLAAKLLLSFLESWEIFLNICCSFPVRLDSRSLHLLSEHKLPYVIFRWDECSLTICGKNVSPKHSSSWTLKIKVERLRVEFAELGIYTQPFLTLFFHHNGTGRGPFRHLFLCISLFWRCSVCGVL